MAKKLFLLVLWDRVNSFRIVVVPVHLRELQGRHDLPEEDVVHVNPIRIVGILGFGEFKSQRDVRAGD